MRELVDAWRGGLIVSCQAPEDSPLRDPTIMAAMARAAAMAGAVGIRANGPADVAAIRAVVDLPIIGIDKRADLEPEAYITPNLASVEGLVRAGASVVAIDATLRPRRHASSPPTAAAMLAQVRAAFPDLIVMADVATLAEGLAAAAAGADLVATTLSGYTADSPSLPGPDVALIAALVRAQPRPVIAEGRISTPGDLRAAFAAGATAVVVGTAITDPLTSARRFVAATPRVDDGRGG